MIVDVAEASGVFDWDAKMRWGRLELSGHRVIIFTHGVDIVGWPERIPFTHPNDMKVRDLEEVLRGLRTNKIQFVRLELEELKKLAQASGCSLHWRLFYAGRVDNFEKRAVRPPETGSKKKNRKPVKTAAYVDDSD